MPQELQNRISLNINKTTAKGPALLVGIPNILPVSQDLSIGFVNLEVELPALLLWAKTNVVDFSAYQYTESIDWYESKGRYVIN